MSVYINVHQYSVVLICVCVQNNRAVMPVYIGVNDIGIHIITVDTKVRVRQSTYTDVGHRLSWNIELLTSFVDHPSRSMGLTLDSF